MLALVQEFLPYMLEQGDGAILTAEKIRAAIAEISLPGLDLAITASVGIATYPDHATSTERLERLADSALYLAKRTGRDRVELASAAPLRTENDEPARAELERAETNHAGI